MVTKTFPASVRKWSEEYSEWFQDTKVICLPDNDNTGRKGIHLIDIEISKVAGSVIWLELQNIAVKGNLSDWPIRERGYVYLCLNQ